MKQDPEKRQEVIQNLQDAGCEAALIHQFMQFWESGQRGRALELLDIHRRVLLDRCHAEERKIDCLDYLAYQIEQGWTSAEGGSEWKRKFR